MQLVRPLLTHDEHYLISDPALMTSLETLLLTMTNSCWLCIVSHGLDITTQRCILGRIWYIRRLWLSNEISQGTTSLITNFTMQYTVRLQALCWTKTS